MKEESMFCEKPAARSEERESRWGDLKKKKKKKKNPGVWPGSGRWGGGRGESERKTQTKREGEKGTERKPASQGTGHAFPFQGKKKDVKQNPTEEPSHTAKAHQGGHEANIRIRVATTMGARGAESDHSRPFSGGSHKQAERGDQKEPKSIKRTGWASQSRGNPSAREPVPDSLNHPMKRGSPIKDREANITRSQQGGFSRTPSKGWSSAKRGTRKKP